MADKYIKRDAVSGKLQEVEATDVSAGAGDAGEVVALNSSGEIDATMLPSGTGAVRINVNAGEALAANDLVYIDAAGEALLAFADVAGNGATGFVLAATLIGDPVDVYFEGIVQGQVGLTPGSRQYLSDTTPGGLTSTPVTGTGKVHQYIGKALTATSVLFEADDCIALA